MSKKGPFLALFLVVATELIGFGLIVPILPQLALQFEVSQVLIGVLLSAYSFAQFFAAPILGALSDKYGRRRLLIMSKIGTILAYILLAFSNSYMLFLMARLLDGFTGGNISIARAYVADVTTPENRPKGMAIIGISFALGFILGPALGSVLYGTSYGYMLPALVAGGLSGLALIFTLFFLPEPEKRGVSTTAAKSLLNVFSLVKGRNVWTILGVQLVYMIVFSGFETTFVIFTAQEFYYTEKQNSLLFVFVGFLALLIQGYLSRRAPKHLKKGALFGFAIASIGFACLSAVMSLSTLLMALVVISLGIGFINVYLPSLISVSVDENAQGGVMGVYEGVGSLSRIIGPLLAYGLFFSYLRVGYLVYTVALCIMVFVVGGLYVYKGVQDESEDS